MRDTRNGFTLLVYHFILAPITLKEFTVKGKPQRLEIRPGDDVEMKCSVDGCPKLVTITRNAHPIAEMTSSTTALVHKIQGVNCSHMGTYRCLAQSQAGHSVHATADLEVEGCEYRLATMFCHFTMFIVADSVGYICSITHMILLISFSTLVQYVSVVHVWCTFLGISLFLFLLLVETV